MVVRHTAAPITTLVVNLVVVQCIVTNFALVGQFGCDALNKVYYSVDATKTGGVFGESALCQEVT
jgi:hypothetical protein